MTSSPRLLSEIPLGTKARITGYTLAPESRQRLLEMGLTPGSEIEVIRVAPMGDPLDLKIRHYHLSIRKEDAAGIHVELL
jgi:Fe2+ transport system protein FeoA